MNNQDLTTLHFFLTATEQELTEWYNSATDIEHQYARELMSRYHAEMVSHAEEALQEWELDAMTEEGVFPNAEQVLEKYLH